MRKLYLHFVRLIKNMGCLFVLLFLVTGPWSVIIIFPICLVISLLFFRDPIDYQKINEQFTEEELKILDAEKVEEHVSDDLYLSLYVKMMNLLVNQHIDEDKQKIIIELNEDSLVYNYHFYDKETKEQFDKKYTEGISMIKNDLVKQFVPYHRLKNSHRNLIVRYYDLNSDNFTETIVNWAQTDEDTHD